MFFYAKYRDQRSKSAVETISIEHLPIYSLRTQSVFVAELLYFSYFRFKSLLVICLHLSSLLSKPKRHFLPTHPGKYQWLSVRKTNR